MRSRASGCEAIVFFQVELGSARKIIGAAVRSWQGANFMLKHRMTMSLTGSKMWIGAAIALLLAGGAPLWSQQAASNPQAPPAQTATAPQTTPQAAPNA